MEVEVDSAQPLGYGKSLEEVKQKLRLSSENYCHCDLLLTTLAQAFSSPPSTEWKKKTVILAQQATSARPLGLDSNVHIYQAVQKKEKNPVGKKNFAQIHI